MPLVSCLKVATAANDNGNGQPAAAHRGCAALGVTLDEAQAARLLRLLDELSQLEPQLQPDRHHHPREAMISAHLLDSLAAQPELQGRLIADVGTGAGFPGLPLAVLEPLSGNSR